MADLDALREALAAALAALDDTQEEHTEQHRSNADRQRAYRARKRNAARNGVTENVTRNVPESVTERYAESGNSRGVTADVTGNPGNTGISPVTEVEPLHPAATRNGVTDAVTRSVTRNAHEDVTGPVKKCPRCDGPMAEINGQPLCLTCEQRDNYDPTVSDPEVAGYWHERLKDTARGKLTE